MIQFLKFGQNPSFGSRDRMQIRFWSKFDTQSHSVVTILITSDFYLKSLEPYSELSKEPVTWLRKTEK